MNTWFFNIIDKKYCNLRSILIKDPLGMSNMVVQIPKDKYYLHRVPWAYAPEWGIYGIDHVCVLSHSVISDSLKPQEL